MTATAQTVTPDEVAAPNGGQLPRGRVVSYALGDVANNLICFRNTREVVPRGQYPVAKD